MSIEAHRTPNDSEGTARAAQSRHRVVPASLADQLKKKIVESGGSESELHELFDELSKEVGSEEASRLWWAAFGATDAADT